MRAGERVASIGLRGEEHAMRLFYEWNGWDEDWQNIDERVPIFERHSISEASGPTLIAQAS